MMNRERYPAMRFSQYEFTNTRLLQTILYRSGIRPGDRVLDIGAGSGTITRLLLERGARVIAIEKDRQLYLKCRKLSLDQPGLTAVHADFLQYGLPLTGRYKIFANIPFFHSADILHKLLFDPHPPEDCYLIVQKEVAEKYSGNPRSTLMSLLIEPVWWSTIIYRLNRTDFNPRPSVDTVVLQLERRSCRLVTPDEYSLYRDFIVYCREDGKSTVKRALGGLFPYRQFKSIVSRLGIPVDSRPVDLSFQQYLGLFQVYVSLPYTDRSVIRGAAQRFLQMHIGMERVHRTRVHKDGFHRD